MIFFISWLLPGAGHFYLKKKFKSIVFLAGTILLLSMGVLMQGKFFVPYTVVTSPFGVATESYHPLLILGFLGDLGSGIFYFIISMLGLGKGAISEITFNYGTTYMVSAGLINYLVALNAFDIAKKQVKEEGNV